MIKNIIIIQNLRMKTNMNLNSEKNPNLLIIENDTGFSQLFTAVLQKEYFDAEICPSISDYYHRLNQHPFPVFDIIILDCDNLSCSEQNIFMHLHSEYPETPVILIGAGDSYKFIPDNTGDKFLVISKPFDMRQLLHNIYGVLQLAVKSEIATDINAQLFTSDWIEISAKSEIDYLSKIQNLCSILLSKKISASIVDDIKLAMEEYGRNAIEWGNKFDRNKFFKISYCVFSDRIVLKFEDEGDGFDLKSIPDPSKDPVTHLEQRRIAGKRPGGYGIFMMKQIMDDVLYNEKGNVCLMSKYIDRC